MVEGLTILILGLANNAPLVHTPDGWEPHEWAYLKGLASGALSRLREHVAREDEGERHDDVGPSDERGT